jgi:hypothetical protein
MDLLHKPGSGLPGDASPEPKLPATRLLAVERDSNPLRRRGYVSPHIGKVAPLDAGALEEIARLATFSLAPCPGPTLVIGMTESALLLSWFLAARLRGEVDLRFTTRERRQDIPQGACGNGTGQVHTFLEPHSHGPVHSLSLPSSRKYPRVVIVEDELTTGATLRNLLLSISNIANRYHVVALSDRRPEGLRERLREEMDGFGIELRVLDLSNEGCLPCQDPPNGQTSSPRNPFGRPGENLNSSLDDLRRRWRSLRPEGLYAIGECVDVALAVWESFPESERPAFRHVTRSPWLVNGGAITSRLDLIAPPAPRHFLYNWTTSLPSRALLVGEASTAAIAGRLRDFLLSRGVEAETIEVPGS